MPSISVKAQSFGESVIRAMTRVSNRFGAINLSQGFPDFDPPEELIQALEHVARKGPHQYAVTWGAQDFRAALAEKQSRFMGIPIDPDEHIVVTCGSTEAMMAAMLTAVDPGDKVIVFSPFYENYLADSVLSDAEPICVPLRAPDFSFDPAELRAAFASGAKALILCNPANPTGKVFSREQIIEQAYGDDYEGVDRNVDSYVKKIRQKIERDPRSPEILVTKYGAGYALGGTKR